MVRRIWLSAAVAGLLLSQSADVVLGRGFGGGGRAGGFSGAHPGGGMGGAHSYGGAGAHNFGGYGGGAHNYGGAGAHNFGAYGGGMSPNRGPGGGYGGAGRPGEFGGRGEGFNPGGLSGGFGAGERGAAGGFGGDRFSSPNRSQLNNFLGLPSDEGAHHLGSTGLGVGNLGVGSDLGLGGGRPGAGIGGRPGVGVGGDFGIGGGRVGAGWGGLGRPGVGVGGYGRVSPAARYATASAVRSNYHHWGVYGAGWYTNHPGAWFAAGWGAGAAWRAATWESMGAWMSYYPAAPVYYDYGNNVTYQDDGVYVDGTNQGSSEAYYNQASNLATTGAKADAPADADWLPLGVFALTKPGSTDSEVTIQLAVNKAGVIRGNYTDTKTDKTQLIQGSVDKQTQRVAFSVGDNSKNLVETGLYNLTKDEAPVLLHFGKERTEQWLLVRLKNSDAPTP